jgi:hypothetical protein
VVELEAGSRTPDATRAWVDEPDPKNALFIPVEELLAAGTEP